MSDESDRLPPATNIVGTVTFNERRQSMDAPKYPDLYACWDREDQKIMHIDDDLNRLYETMSYGGYASRVVGNHPGFDILRYTLLGPVK